MNEHVCHRCKRQTMSRKTRETFMERVVYPFFGKYPWTCKVCRSTEMLTDRGPRRRRKNRNLNGIEDKGKSA
jgi:hypothetical protein